MHALLFTHLCLVSSSHRPTGWLLMGRSCATRHTCVDHYVALPHSPRQSGVAVTGRGAECAPEELASAVAVWGAKRLLVQSPGEWCRSCVLRAGGFFPITSLWNSLCMGKGEAWELNQGSMHVPLAWNCYTWPHNGNSYFKTVDLTFTSAPLVHNLCCVICVC